MHRKREKNIFLLPLCIIQIHGIGPNRSIDWKFAGSFVAQANEPASEARSRFSGFKLLLLLLLLLLVLLSLKAYTYTIIESDELTTIEDEQTNERTNVHPSKLTQTHRSLVATMRWRCTGATSAVGAASTAAATTARNWSSLKAPAASAATATHRDKSQAPPSLPLTRADATRRWSGSGSSTTTTTTSLPEAAAAAAWSFQFSSFIQPASGRRRARERVQLEKNSIGACLAGWCALFGGCLKFCFLLSRSRSGSKRSTHT